MLKVFLVEDEVVVRESLRNNIPWNEYGFEFAGEAGDGESALPLIRKLRPDVVITDIKMPFMDGLTLSHLLKKEFPRVRVIVMSGYDDFEYARRAIREGVEQYLLKPITRKSMREALEEVRTKIDAEREQENYVEQYRLESREYEQMQRREFLEKIFGGHTSLEDLYEEASRLGIDLRAESFNVILFSIRDREDAKTDPDADSESWQEAVDELNMFFLRYPAYLLSGWMMSSFVVLIRGDQDSVPGYTGRAMEKIREVCSAGEGQLEWYAAEGEPVARFSQLKDCFDRANHAFACRFWKPEAHILTLSLAESFAAERNADGSVMTMDPARADASVVKEFLTDGEISEIHEFVEGYLLTFSDVLKSGIFRGYLVLNTRFAVIAFVKKLGVSQDVFTKETDGGQDHFNFKEEEVGPYLEKLIRRALEYRDQVSARKGSRVLEEAKSYIEQHYRESDLSLNAAAKAAGVSGSYLSGVFSREEGSTFVEYLTARRMKEAGRLLRDEKMHTADVAAAVGYRDPHYFSYVFRKTMGCSTREYRAGGVQ